MVADRIDGTLDFLREAERLKDVLRSGRTGAGRQESTAEHSWRLCLMAMVFARDLSGIDLSRLLRICVVHDLGEALRGDVPAVEQAPDDGRAARERADLESLTAPLPAEARAEILDLAAEYEAGITPEAVLAKGFDKLETILQHSQGANAPGFDYAFNLDYGRSRTDAHPLLAVIRERIDAATRARIEAPAQGDRNPRA